MITGSEVETTVLDRIATNMPRSSPDMASRTCRWVMTALGWASVIDDAVGSCDLIVWSLQ